MKGNSSSTNSGTEGSNGSDSHKRNKHSNIEFTLRKRPFDDNFDEKMYKQLLLEIVKNNVHGLALVESPQFKDLTSYLNPNLPSSVTSCNMGPEVKRLLAQSSREIKAKLSMHEGGYGILLSNGSLDTNACSNKNSACPDDIYNYVAVTAHYYDDDFVMQTYILDFFIFEGKFGMCEGNEYLKLLEDTFRDFGISDRILTVTVGADVILRIQFCSPTGSQIGIQPQICEENICLRQGLIKAAEQFLSGTYFWEALAWFEDILEDSEEVQEIEQSHPKIGVSVKQLPVIIRSVVKQLHGDSFMARTFKQILDERKSGDNPKTFQLPKVDDEEQWLLTYEMIARFLYFKDEINELLCRMRSLSKTDRDDLELELEADEITVLQWEHLSIVHKILDIFRDAVEKIDISGQIGINDSISFLSNISKDLEKWKSRYDYKTKPFIDVAIDGLDIFTDYYILGDSDIKESILLYIASVLDPRYKLGLFSDLGFSTDVIDKIKTYVYELYLRYQRQYNGYSIGFEELNVYLSQERVSGAENIIEFYKSHKKSFPTIYRMAKDILAIPAISASDEMFSGIQGIMSDTKYSLKEKKLVSLLTLRGVIENQ